MDNKTLAGYLDSMIADSIIDTALHTENKQLFASYSQAPYGNEEEARSQVVSADHYDLVESDIAALVETFLSGGNINSFKPLGKDDKEEADQKTKYANYIIRQQKDSFKVLHDWMKEPGFSKISVVHYAMEDTTSARYVTYEGVSEEEKAAILDDLEKDYADVKIEEHDDWIRFKVIEKSKKISVVNVPVGSFIMSKGATNKDTAPLVGHYSKKTKSELISMGFDVEDSVIKDLPQYARNAGQGNSYANQPGLAAGDNYSGASKYGSDNGSYAPTWASEEVLVETLFPLIDYDDDGALERRNIIKVGDVILQNEPYGHAPYAILSQILMPHTAIGESRGDMAAKYQKQKTAVERGLFDNIYSVSKPRAAIDGSNGGMNGRAVDLDAYLDHVIGGVVLTDGDPTGKILPLTTPYIGDAAMQVMQLIDGNKAASVGQQLTSQGLNTDDFGNETATRFKGIDAASKAKIKLVARVYAETGFRDLYDGVIWTAQHFQDSSTEIMVLGEELTIDPRGWRFEHTSTAEVGLALGEQDEAAENLGALINTQMMLKDKGSPLVDDVKFYNSLTDVAKIMGEHDVSRYFNNPERPEQLLKAENEQLLEAATLMQQQLQQNPLAEAEEIKARAELVKAQATQELNIAKLQEDQRQFNLEMLEKQQKAIDDLNQRYIELELKYNTDIENEGQGN